MIKILFILCPSEGTLVVTLVQKVQLSGPHLCAQTVLEIRVLGIELLFVCGELPLPEKNWEIDHSHSFPELSLLCTLPTPLQTTNTMLSRHLVVCLCRVHLLVLGSSDYLYENNKQCQVKA